MSEATFGERLHSLLKETGMTHLELARKARVSRPAVSGWIRGTLPTPRSLIRIADVFGVSPTWLREGVGSKKSEAIAQRREAEKEFATYLAFGPDSLSTKRDKIAKNPFAEFIADTDEATRIHHELIDVFEELAARSESDAIEYRSRVRDLVADAEQVRRRVAELHRQLARSAAGLSDSDKSKVDDVLQKRYKRSVVNPNEILPKLIEDVKRLTSERGSRAALARRLLIPPQRLNEYLKGNRSPGGKISILLRDWVREQESVNAKKDLGTASTAPRRSTQSDQESTHEKTGSRKASHKGAKSSTTPQRRKRGSR